MSRRSISGSKNQGGLKGAPKVVRGVRVVVRGESVVVTVEGGARRDCLLALNRLSLQILLVVHFR